MSDAKIVSAVERAADALDKVAAAATVAVEKKPLVAATAPTLPDSQDLKSILDHVRGQFQYHAGQRLNTIRFFFLAYGIFAVAYGNALKELPIHSILPLIISLSAAVVTLVFWAFDYRNEKLVRVGDAGLKELEGLIALKYSLAHFKMGEKWDHPPEAWLPWVKYRWITPTMYFYFLALSLAAACYAWRSFNSVLSERRYLDLF